MAPFSSLSQPIHPCPCPRTPPRQCGEAFASRATSLTSLADEQAHPSISTRRNCWICAGRQELSLVPDVASDSDEESSRGRSRAARQRMRRKRRRTHHSTHRGLEQTHQPTSPTLHRAACLHPPSSSTSIRSWATCSASCPRHSSTTIATNTNLYAAFKEAPPGWATTSAEVWQFISVHIYMGIIDLPYLHMYWEEGVEAAVRRQRLLSGSFHGTPPLLPHRRAHPCGCTRRTVVEKINRSTTSVLSTFPQFFTPPEIITLDETMVRFKGRSSLEDSDPGQAHSHRL